LGIDTLWSGTAPGDQSVEKVQLCWAFSFLREIMFWVVVKHLQIITFVAEIEYFQQYINGCRRGSYPRRPSFFAGGIPREYDDLTAFVQLERFLQNIDSDETVPVCADAVKLGMKGAA
jgi:hypothetical protein